MSLPDFQLRLAARHAFAIRRAVRWLEVTRAAATDETMSHNLDYILELCEAAAIGLDTLVGSCDPPCAKGCKVSQCSVYRARHDLESYYENSAV